VPSSRRVQKWTSAALGRLRRGETSSFVASLPRQSRLLLYAAVFCMFGSIGFLVDIMQSTVQSALYVIAFALFTGLVAVAFTFLITFHPRWFPVALAGQFAVMFSGLFDRSGGISYQAATLDAVRAKLYIDAIGCLLCFVGSYSAFMRLIVTEGKRYARAHAEIELAREIHQLLVPTVSWSDARHEIHGISRSSTEVGGDLVDLAHTPDGWIGYVADISGHGVGAGLMMGILKSAMRTRVASPVTVDDLLAHVNQVLVPLSKPNMYATLALLHDHGGRHLTFSVAGHPPILHYRAGTATIAEITVPHIPLGMFPDRTFTSATVDAAPGDLFVIVTDGLIEVFNAADEDFGMDRLKSVIGANAMEPLPQIADAVLRATTGFGPQADDQTLLLVRVRAPAPASATGVVEPSTRAPARTSR
jgi:hypothetical protein